MATGSSLFLAKFLIVVQSEIALCIFVVTGKKEKDMSVVLFIVLPLYLSAFLQAKGHKDMSFSFRSIVMWGSD